MTTTTTQIDAILKLNDDFHNNMIEAQKTFHDGIPINVLACFFAVQIAMISKKYPNFSQMVTAEVERRAKKFIDED